jgi:hypothetical protein
MEYVAYGFIDLGLTEESIRVFPLLSIFNSEPKFAFAL